jgi:hypothetical protein
MWKGQDYRVAGIGASVRPDGLVINDEAAEVAIFHKTPGLRAFISGHSLPGSSDIMCGSRDLGWSVVVHCVGGDHAERAARYLAEYRTLR